MIVLQELILRPTPLAVVLAESLGDARIVLQGPQIAAREDLVIADDAIAGGVVAFGIVPVHADEVGGDGAVIVGVGLGVGQRVPLGSGRMVLAGLGVAEQEFEIALVILRRLFDGQAIFGGVGHAEAEAVGLDAPIARAFRAGT